jgi:hypothetical protein
MRSSKPLSPTLSRAAARRSGDAGRQVVLHAVHVADVDEVLPVFLAQFADVPAMPANLARDRFEQAAQDAQETGLAGAVRPRDAQQGSGGSGEVEAGNQASLAAFTRQINDFQHSEEQGRRAAAEVHL